MQVREIVEDIRDAFLARLDKMTWLDEVTKKDVIIKVSIVFNILL
jgi:predicted metalloendopeptidase